MRGVWIGKYPHELVQNIYAFAAEKPNEAASIQFVRWLLTEGQNTLADNGLNELLFSERPIKLETINPLITVEKANAKGNTLVKIVLVAFILLAVVMFTFNMFYSKKAKSKNQNEELLKDKHIIHAQSMNLPKGLYYDKTHTWVYMNENGYVKIGLDDFIQHVTGPYTKIQMKEPGEKIKRNDPIITIIQDGKQLVLYAPVSGTIKEINEDLVTEPSLINNAPYSNGWVYELEPSNWLREIQFMRMADKYREWLGNEFTRLKDFLTVSKGNNQAVLSPVIYQEGGALLDYVLMEMGPQTWEDFQKEFVDISGLH
jgi:glycine cleavage system H lipoate-binding protein